MMSLQDLTMEERCVVCFWKRNLSLRMKLRRKEVREKWYGINGLAVSAVSLYLVLLEEITTTGHVRYRTRNVFGFQLALKDIRQYMVQFSAGYSVIGQHTQIDFGLNVLKCLMARFWDYLN
ncbi:hypothetical protein Tco_1324236 [Tanacetum coccineum]